MSVESNVKETLSAQKGFRPTSDFFRCLALVGAIVIILILQAVLVPGSVTLRQVMNIARQASGLGIVAIGQALVILSGGIDLSVGSVITLANVLCTTIMVGRNENTFLGVTITLLVCAFIGFINGMGVVKLRIAPFIMTLCMMSVAQGAFLVYTGGSPGGMASPALRAVSTTFFFNKIPCAALVWLFSALIIWAILKFTTFGRSIYATGANATAARLSGIPTQAVTISVFVICSTLVGLAGLLMSGFIGTSSLSLGADYINNSLAAVLVGGNAISGGKGGILGVVLATYLIFLLFALLTMLALGQVGKLIAQGLIIFAVVAVQKKFN